MSIFSRCAENKGEAPSVRKTLIKALENGMVLTNGKANEITMSSEGGRALRQLRQDGYPISERWRENKLRKGRPIKEFFYTEETRRKLREERAMMAKGIFN